MLRIFIIIFILFFSFNLISSELTSQEKIIFNFVDLNKDNNISKDELDNLIKFIYNLLDENKDGNISESEIIELKNLVQSLT